MPGRTYVGASQYRYGFNGKEKDDEVKGAGNSIDFGIRIYDPRIGRWLSIDKLADKYADMSPYNFALNTPLQAKDPDGKVVIFINGMHSGNGGSAKYWGGFDRRAMNKIGDHSARYVDGAIGGANNTLAFASTGFFSGGILGALIKVYTCSNVSLAQRISAGEAQGYHDAAGIIANLSEGETIKIVTHSMGTGYGAGYEQGIMDYVMKNYTGEERMLMLGKIKTKLRVDISSFQGDDIPPIQDNVPSINIKGGLDGGGTNVVKTTPGNSVPTVNPVAGEKNATDASDAKNGHAISDLSAEQIPFVGGAGTESKRPVEEGNNNTNPH